MHIMAGGLLLSWGTLIDCRLPPIWRGVYCEIRYSCLTATAGVSLSLCRSISGTNIHDRNQSHVHDFHRHRRRGGGLTVSSVGCRKGNSISSSCQHYERWKLAGGVAKQRN